MTTLRSLTWHRYDDERIVKINPSSLKSLQKSDQVTSIIYTKCEAHLHLVSSVGGQGMIHCNCRGECTTNGCSCKKANRLCSSRCHRNNSRCKNKTATEDWCHPCCTLCHHQFDTAANDEYNPFKTNCTHRFCTKCSKSEMFKWVDKKFPCPMDGCHSQLEYGLDHQYISELTRDIIREEIDGKEPTHTPNNKKTDSLTIW